MIIPVYYSLSVFSRIKKTLGISTTFLDTMSTVTRSCVIYAIKQVCKYMSNIKHVLKELISFCDHCRHILIRYVISFEFRVFSIPTRSGHIDGTKAWQIIFYFSDIDVPNARVLSTCVHLYLVFVEMFAMRVPCMVSLHAFRDQILINCNQI